MHWRYCELLAGAVGNFATASLGCTIAWPSPVFPKLVDPELTDNPFGEVLVANAQTWTDSAPAIGGIGGPLLASWIADRKGRRLALLLSTVLYIVVWLLFMIVHSVPLLIVSRTLAGFANGYVLLAATLYIGEIASDQYRGALGCYLQIGTTFGILYVYCLGPFVGYLALQGLCCAVSILFGTLFLYMPETPHHLIAEGHLRRASETLMFLRGRRNIAEVHDELEELKQYVLPSSDPVSAPEQTVSRWGPFRRFKQLFFRGSANRRALAISLGVVLCQQWTGIDGILSSSELIFAKAGMALDAVYSTIVLGAVQFFFSCLSPLFIDRFGRRPILLLTSAGLAIALAALGAYFLLERHGVVPLRTIGWMPLAASLLFVALYNAGFGPVAWALVMELFAHDVKPLGLSLAVSWLLLCDFLVLRLFAYVSESFGFDWAFWMLATACVLAIAFCWWAVIETRGLTLYAIQERLRAVKVIRL
ncbi:facilitated trehalose transporter Tret1-2 homolog [Anopheles bellator]|uniref:facilitated trehalose transporter Tret1-2 homolog n=1 Tax=Anopheles bellator TaxID=139047 RepID=UPI00264742EE|nr:facilitated trehalose transporter Tret1-2 homolog [Anopheles bellator]